MDCMQSLRRWLRRFLFFWSLQSDSVWPRHLTLRRKDQWTAIGILAVYGGIAVIAAALDNAHGRGWVEIERCPRLTFDGRVPVNRSHWSALCILPGVGETIAKRIARDRDDRGSFRSARELTRVAGLGPRGVMQMEPWIDIRPSPPGKSPGGY